MRDDTPAPYGSGAARFRRHSGGIEPEAIRVRLLGGFGVSVGSRTVEGSRWRLKKAGSLVKLLALARGHRLHREQIMDALWPDLDAKSAANNLHRTLHFAREVLEATPANAASRYLPLRGGLLELCPDSPLWVDVEAFESAAITARRARELAAYRAAVDLYAGDLLPEDRYEAWAEERREGLRMTYLSLLMEMAELHEERGEYGPGIEALRRVLAEESSHEEAHAGLMRLYALSGRNQEAILQYERLRKALSRELAMEPGAASQRSYTEIRAGKLPAAPAASASRQSERPIDSSKHNLPTSLTSFVGREHETLEVKRLLSITRLLTLTGAGGSGKTRLALEIARDFVGTYPDGVWLVELATLSKPELAPQAVAAAIGVPEQAGRPLNDTLADYLRSKSLLLVLDNCEHLVDGAARLADTLLSTCLNLKIMATSREPLGVPGEAVWLVPPLSLPGADGESAVQDLMRSEAVRLFVDRARSRLPDFELKRETAGAVASVCLKLDGIPLAIELATAQIGALAVEQIAERLEDSLKLLTGGARTVDPRQQTLRATLDWSHGLLSGQEKVVFRHLSAFSGGFTLEAAEEVCAGEGIEKSEVLDLLSHLVDKSLVLVTGRRGEARYRLLETVRQYASERLESEGEEEAVRQHHALFFLELAERAEPELSKAGQATWLDRLENDLDNLRTAVGWFRKSGQRQAHLRLAGTLWRFCYLHGHYEEGRGWLEGALARGGDAPPSARAKALLGAGILAFLQCEYDHARVRLEEALALYRTLGDERGVASASQTLGSIARERGDYARSEALHGESLTLWRKLGDEAGEARSLNYLGFVAWLQQKHERARELCEETLVRFRGLGDNEVIAWALISLGSSALYAGDRRRARALLDESLALSREVGYKEGVAWSLNQLGVLAHREGDHRRAADQLRESLEIHRNLGDRWRAASVLEGLAEAFCAQGHLEPAARLFGAAEAVREAISVPVPLCERSDHEESISATRGALGETAFEASFSEGRDMSSEQAIEYALTYQEKPPPPQQEEPSTEHLALTGREEEVAALLAHGLTNRRIAEELSISERTVDTHVARILKKLALRSREQVADYLERRHHEAG